MIRDRLGPADMVDFLNELLRIDPKFVTDLVASRVGCGREMADHATVQVGKAREWGITDRPFAAGFLGVINGFFGVYDEEPKQGWGPITACLEPDGRIYAFALTRSEEGRQGCGMDEEDGA